MKGAAAMAPACAMNLRRPVILSSFLSKVLFGLSRVTVYTGEVPVF
jgi:hypothetical protein